MQVAYAFLAESVEVNAEGRFFVFRGGIEAITCVGLPTFMPLIGLIAKIRFGARERDQVGKLVVKLTDPDDEEIGPNIQTDVSVSAEGITDGRDLYHVFSVTLVGLRINKAGEHKFKFFLDGEADPKVVSLYVDVRSESTERSQE